MDMRGTSGTNWRKQTQIAPQIYREKDQYPISSLTSLQASLPSPAPFQYNLNDIIPLPFIKTPKYSVHISFIKVPSFLGNGFRN